MSLCWRSHGASRRPDGQKREGTMDGSEKGTVSTGDGQPRLDYEVHDDPAKKLARVRLKGRIDVFNYLQLSGALGDVAGDRQGLNLVLDLSDVVFIASSGWS